MPQYFLGIDSGTQSTKALIINERGETQGRGQSAYDLIEDLPSGHKEQHPQTWIDALIAAVSQAMQDADAKPDEVVAIGVSGQQHGFVPLDASDEVIRPAKLWCDTSTAPQCQTILERVGGLDQCIGLTGNGMPPGFTASKILWLKENEPENFSRLQTVLLPHDFLNFWLTGEKRMEWGDASGTALLDVRTREWRPELLNAIDANLADKLPSLAPSWEPCGTLRAGAAEALGLHAGALVSAGGGDNMMGAIGTGNVRSGRVTMSLGTSGTVYAHSDRPVVDPRGEIAAFCSSDGAWLPLMCTMNCTVTTELTRRLLDADLAGFEERIASAPRGAEGVITLPFFNGERTPNLPRARACFLGLDSHNTRPGNLLRSAVEGATFALRYGLKRLGDLGIEAREIVLTGGGSGSATWRQVVADVCGAPVTVLRQDEGASFGAALQALSVLGGGQDGGNSDDLAELVDQHLARNESLCCEPDRPAVDFYDEAYRRYQQAVNAVKTLYA